MDALTEDQQRTITAQAQAAGGAQAAIELLTKAGFNIEATIAALLTGATALIEASYPSDRRLFVLDTLLADTVREWGGSIVAETIQ